MSLPNTENVGAGLSPPVPSANDVHTDLLPGDANLGADGSRQNLGADSTRQNVGADRARQNRRGPDSETLEYWDTLNGIADGAIPDTTTTEMEDIPPEHMPLGLPSNGTVGPAHKALELKFRKKKANALLDEIRNLIADKSFKYTDQIRAAPRKGVRTRAQTSILDLDRHLSFLCQAYTWSHEKMIHLGIDASTEEIYRPLTKEDVKCSTAVLKPNQKGSTKLRLSWIWQSVDRRIMAGLDPLADGAPPTDPQTLEECKCTLFMDV